MPPLMRELVDAPLLVKHCGLSTHGSPSMAALASKNAPLAARIECGAIEPLGLAALADDLDLESGIGLGRGRRHIAERQ